MEIITHGNCGALKPALMALIARLCNSGINPKRVEVHKRTTGESKEMTDEINITIKLK